MGDIIHLGGDAHEHILRLLPWYANGTLDPVERNGVEAHLATCAECSRELDFDLAIAGRGQEGPDETDGGWAALQVKIQSSAQGSVVHRPMRTPLLLRRRIPLGGALAAQAAAIMLMVGGALWLRPVAQPVYHALGAQPASVAPGNLIVMWRPDTTEQAIRQTLAGNHVRLVDGPTVSGAYILQVAADQRSAALSRLQRDPNITLAQPIDGGAQP